MAKVQAQPTRYIAAGSTRIATVSFVGMLDDGETLTGTPTVTQATLNPTSISVNASALLIDDAEGSQIQVPIGKAVQFKVSGAVAGTDYSVAISVGTSAGQTLTTTVTLSGVATTE